VQEGFVSDIQDLSAGLSYVIDKVKRTGDIFKPRIHFFGKKDLSLISMTSLLGSLTSLTR
jgi:hypothetical protein